MLRRFCRWMLYKQMGWTKNITVEHPPKYIICLAPHTSNWDFLVGLLFSRAEGITSHFLMKKEWFFWPLGPIFRSLGGIPVWRSRQTSMTDLLADQARKASEFHLCVTPEGTRSLNPDWKKGFYLLPRRPRFPFCSTDWTIKANGLNAPDKSSPPETWKTISGKSNATSNPSPGKILTCSPPGKFNHKQTKTCIRFKPTAPEQGASR